MLETKINPSQHAIELYAEELSDLYALKTLYNFAMQHIDTYHLDFYFSGCVDIPRAQEILQGANTRESSERNKSRVCCLSDLYNTGALEIDVALLKNSVTPLTQDEKAKLRAKYGITTQEPVVVIGFAEPTMPVGRVIQALYEHATIYLVGPAEVRNYWVSAKIAKKLHAQTKKGYLKDYYAMADIALNARNLEPTNQKLNNFVEATEGGPLFIAPAEDIYQYGYKQLVAARAIIECDRAKGDWPFIDGVIEEVQKYLAGPRDTTNMHRMRSSHLQKTRDTYMPVILAHVQHLAGQKVRIPRSNLRRSKGYESAIRLEHPESNWRGARRPGHILKSTLNKLKYAIQGELEHILFNIQELTQKHWNHESPK